MYTHVLQEYEELSGLAELKAKLQYIQLCRSLKTYGVTFFHVKEKMKGRSKLVPRLLGITFDCIMTVDEKTKEVCMCSLAAAYIYSSPMI